MASKRASETPRPGKPKVKLENLAARPPSDDDEDEQMVDTSGVFRVTSALQQAQTGHEEDDGLRFASESLVIKAQRDGFRDDGTTMEDVLDDNVIVDEAATAIKRQRLATLAARAAAQRDRRR